MTVNITDIRDAVKLAVGLGEPVVLQVETPPTLKPTVTVLDPPSTSRKKRRQVGAYVKHTDAAGNRHERNVPNPKSRRRKANKARRAMGARGAKTNSLRNGRA